MGARAVEVHAMCARVRSVRDGFTSSSGARDECTRVELHAMGARAVEVHAMGARAVEVHAMGARAVEVHEIGRAHV